MTMVTESDVETNTSTHDARSAFRQAVAAVADKARTKLPACVGRIDSAVKIVLAGDVELLPQGGARVASRSDAQITYLTVNGHCDCRDYARAPEGLCSHRLAYGIARRASELVPQPPPALPTPSEAPLLLPAAPALPEARCSMNLHVMVHGHDVQVTLRGHEETEVLGRLEAILARYPAPEAPAQGQPRQEPDGWCAKHNVAMKLNHGKDGRSWLSHKTADGWCKGK